MILIVSSSEDDHAKVVSAGLRQLGSKNMVWSTGDPLLEPSFSASLNCDEVILQGESLVLGDLQSVWFRREGRVVAPPDWSSAKVETLRFEWLAARRSIFSVLERAEAVWVNEWVAARSAENKGLQLEKATELGFKVPETLISNSPEAILDFCTRHADTGVVHKMFYPADFGAKSSATALLHAGALANPSAMKIAPGIYQRFVPLVFDVRVLVAGQSLVAARLQADGSERVDSRCKAHKPGAVFPIKLAPELEELCFQLVRKMGLVSGSIDLGVAVDGSVVFFEINQAGNFQWMELCNPELPVLDMVCSFLASGDSGFEYGGRRKNGLTLSSFVSPLTQ